MQHNLYRLTAFMLALMAACTGMCADLSTEIRDAIKRLDAELAREAYYTGMRENRIDSLQRLLRHSRDAGARIALLGAIGDAYFDYQIDSALHYYSSAQEAAAAANMPEQEQRYMLMHTTLLPVSGAMREAIDRFESINSADIYPANLADYYDNGSRLYMFVIPYYRNRELVMPYLERGLALGDSAAILSPKDSPRQIYYTALRRFLSQADRPGAVAALTELVDTLPMTSPFYARSALVLRNYYQGLEGHEDQALLYLIQAAISDAISGTREEMALLALGEELYHRGDVDRAYKYLTRSLNHSVDCGASSRSLEASRALPLVAAAQEQQDESKLHGMVLLVAALALALIAIIVVLISLRNDRNKIDAMHKDLVNTNNIKDDIIRQFITTSSLHMERLDEYTRMQLRKLKAGQTADIIKQLSSGQFRAEQSRSYFDIFDAAFLNIYPNFFVEANKLLQSDKQVGLPADTSLTNEQRILAFMRMGIDDAQRIATFLGVAVNTIYTYRNKFRSAAINRDTFEEDIRNIGMV